MSLSVKQIALPAGPILALLAGYLIYSAGMSAEAAVTMSVTALVVVWWIFEPIPIPATSLIPLAVLPLTGVLTSDEIGESYGSPLVLLLLGGFILATALEKNGAHRRIAITMVRAFGGNSSRRLVFGFMAASALLSMWISNTATTLMLLPVAIAVLEKAEDPKLATPLLLGIAYAASVGGIGTPIGTPPNIVFMGGDPPSIGDHPDAPGVYDILSAQLLKVASGLAKGEAYESGVDPTGDMWSQSNIRYYIFALLFVMFDVEAVFIFPWATRLDAYEVFGLIEMAIFIYILLLGLLYAWWGARDPARVVPAQDVAAPTLDRFVASMAALYAGTGDHTRVLERYRALSAARVERHFGLPMGLPMPVLAERIRQAGVVSEARLAVLTEDRKAEDPKELLHAVRELDLLVEEVSR